MFVLKANSEYIFTNRTVGDATEFEVTFTTDGSRRVVTANKVECD